uniref:Fibrocystin-L n=1 Tax=Ornithorhynchus anatinus TaxID=9258 RepID=A0A6I8N1M6_ORNAN
LAQGYTADSWIVTKVTEIIPKYGSINGATRLTIKGEGFAQGNQFNYGVDNELLGNSVHLVSEIRSIPCDVEKDASHATQIICYTRPMPEDTYIVQVIVDGVPVVDNNICKGLINNWKCSFSAKLFRTPTIMSIKPSSGLPGAVITIHGRIFTDVYGSNTALSSNGKNVRILRVYVGGMPCELLKPDSDDLYGLKLDHQNNDMGSVVCKMTGTYVGHHNVSFILDSDYGRSFPQPSTYFISSLHKIAMFQTYAEVTSIFPGQGSIQGGTLLTIRGQFFDQTVYPARVLVGGQICAVQAVTDNSIHCRTPPQPRNLKTVYPGGRGLKLEVWNNSRPAHLEEVLGYNESTPGYMGTTWVDSASHFWPVEQERFVARLSGFLVAPDSDSYRFYIKGDDRYALYFSQTGDPEDKVKIAYHSSYANSYFSSNTQRSDVFHLQKGKEYYIEILLQQYGLSAFVDVGMFQCKNSYSEKQTGDAVNEEQIIQSQSTVVAEIQVITLVNWTTAGAINEVQTITVSSPCMDSNMCSDTQYRLIYNKEKTVMLPADAPGSALQSALNDLWSIKPDTVQVSRTEGNQGYVYSVTFISDRGDFNLLGYEAPEGNNVTVDVVELTKGKPSLDTFTLKWDGISSRPLKPWASGAEVQAALEELVSAKCPKKIAHFTEGFIVQYFRDYETDFRMEDNKRGQKTSETDAFCGRYSLKNPAILFDSADMKPSQHTYGAISLFPYHYLCLAYKGFLAHEIGLKFQYQDSNKSTRSTDKWLSFNFAEGNMNWTYTCIDLLSLIQEKHPGNNFLLQRINLKKASEAQSFYVDVVYIGQKATFSTANGVPKRRLPALANKGIFFKQFQVNQTQTDGSFLTNSYSVTMSSHNCSYRIPLLAVDFTQAVTNTENESVFRGTNWPGESHVLIKRIQTASPPLHGSFDIQAYGHLLQGLPADVSAVDLKYALQSIAEMGEVSVTRQGSCSGYLWRVKWKSAYGNQNLLQINDSNITGVNVNMSATKTREGGVFRTHVLGDLFRTPNHQPQVEVYINGLPSKCSGDCGYKWDNQNTPIISSISPTQGTSDNCIWFAIGKRINLNSEFTTTVIPRRTILVENEIQCHIQNGSGGTFPVALSIAAFGLVQNAGEKGFNFTYRTQISQVWPVSGSLAGGTLLTVSGFGFNQDSKVLVGNKSCSVLKGNFKEIKCRTPMGPEGTVDVTVFTNGLHATVNSAFNYSHLWTPVITDFSPKTRKVFGEVNLTIMGHNFGNELIDNKVYVGGATCKIVEWNSSAIICLLPKLSPGHHNICVDVGYWGFASSSGKLNVSIAYVLQVTNIFPQGGSLYGGTQITIMGSGFSKIPKENSVLFGSFPCHVTTSSENLIKCTLQSTRSTYRVTNSGKHSVYGLGYAWFPAVLDVSVGDRVIWQWQTQPFIRGVGYGVFSVSSLGSVVYDGKGFTSGTRRTKSGSFSYQFTSPGIYYYSSGFIDEAQSIFLQGVINVLPNEDRDIPLHLFIDEIEATYVKGVPEMSPFGRSGSECIEPEPLCPQLVNGIENSPGFSFKLSSCSSPSIINISPSSGTVRDLITITGSGFSNITCAHEVTIGGHPCITKGVSENSIMCQLDPQNSMDIGIGELVSLTVHNLGTAINTLTNEFDRRFVLLPHVDSVTPIAGSTTGMTRVTIRGSGYAASLSDIKVTMGDFPCRVGSANYTTIECETSPAPEHLGDVNVQIRDVLARCPGACSFSYLDGIAPSVTRVNPIVLQTSPTEVLIEGEGFGTILEDIAVYVGHIQVTAASVNEKNITVIATAVPAGSYPLCVVVATKGRAFGNFAIISPAVASLAPTSGSLRGGTILIITGSGFCPGNTTVTIGSNPCLIVSVTYDEVQCLAPARSASTVLVKIVVNSVIYPILAFTYSLDATPFVKEVIPARGLPGTKIQITGSSLGFDVSKILVTIDGIPCNVTHVNDSLLQCTVGKHAGGNFPVFLHHLTKGYAESTAIFEYPLTIENILPREGSFGGGLTMTVIGSGFDPQKSMVRICSSDCEVNRHRSESGTLFCEVPLNNGNGPQHICEVTVANGKDLSQLNAAFTYSSLLTPIITSVAPRRGGTAGGTRLTITGSGFSSDWQDVHVTIAQATCDVELTNKTHIICTTRAQSPSQWTKVHVNIGGSGIARLDNADFFYVDVWSSPFSWGGESPPEEGSLVVITKGQTILLDQSTPVLKMLLIQGGSLIFDEADIELQAENILISDGGILQIGTERAPFQHKAIITLHGHLRSPELPVYGAKTLAVREGILDLHGRPIPVIWTRLAETAEAGENTLVLQEAVMWNVGDEIIIATTGNSQSQRENEKRIIASISADGTVITLTSPLNYTHLAVSVTLPDGTLFEGRAEVGVLTRNILVRGSNNIEWNDKIPPCPEGFDSGEFATQTCLQGKFGEEMGSDQFGGCIMFHAPQPNRNLVTGRLEYVEVFHAGQAFRLGRYPIHWHLLGDLQFKSYVRGCAIHQTYNRAVTIHNTHHLLVERNVIYDIRGGAFFIEDGIEHGNILQSNLAVFVRQSSSLLNDDITPAAFWVTNPNNSIRHNSVAGGTHFGFWYRMNNHPDGPSHDPHICQKRVPLGEFYNNTVHSQGWFGLWIFEEYFPMQTGSCTSTIPTPAIFNALTTWNCRKGAEWVNGGALQFHNFVVVNSADVGIETKRILAPYVGGWGESSGAVIQNAKIVGHLDDLGLGPSYCSSKGLLLPFNEGLTVSSVHFMNFDRPHCAAIGVTSIVGVCTDGCGGWSSRFASIQYFHTPNKAGFRWEHEVVLMDTDGSLTGHKGYSVIPHSSLLDPSHCSRQEEWSVGFPGSLCDSSVSFHRLAFNKPSPTSLLEKDVILFNFFGTSVVPFRKKRLTHLSGWMALIPNANGINWYFKGVDHITNISYTATFYGFKEEDYVIISHNFTQHFDKFRITDKRNGSSNPLNWSSNKNGDWHLEENTTTLFYLVSGRKSSPQSPVQAVARSLDADVRDINIHFGAFHYPVEDCVPSSSSTRNHLPRKRPTIYNLWSNDSFWQSSQENNYAIPQEGADVVIPEGIWLVVDSEMPPMGKLTIFGVLELEENKNNFRAKNTTYGKVVLNATYISVQGGRLIGGWEERPFKGELEILLRGSHSTPDWTLSEELNQGSKVLGVFGELDLHGIPHAVYRTKLSKTALAGSKSLSLVHAVDWQVGEDILITTTSYDSKQTETRRITQISPDHRSLILNDTLSYTHIGERYQVPGTGQNYTLAADVGLLSRNIKIVGEDYPEWYEESFGARVLISSFTSSRLTYKGNARISNVEFYHTGQEGYRDHTDPRYSVSFLNLGQVGEYGSSYIRGCAFHNGFSPAIGVFGTDGVDIDNNIIYFTVGQGITIWGNDNRVRENLVALSLWPGTYQDREDTSSTEWHAAIEETNTVLQNNIVAGFERIWIPQCILFLGQHNPVEEWQNNEAHGGLFGVYMNQDGLPGCSLIQGFTIWKCWDYGIYFQTTESVQIYNVTLVENGMGIFSIIYTPAATSHKISSKTVQVENSLLIGSSPKFNCSDILTNEDPNIRLTATHRSCRPPSGGRSGICWPTFASAHNMAPRKPHAGLMSYNAISGLLKVTDTTFVGFKNVCSGETNVIFMTNPLNEDLQHPIQVTNIRTIDTTEQSKIYIHRPDLSKVNPSDCVDMVCDAKKKAFLKDTDGSFLGSAGSVIPQAEYEWNGNKQYGIGDYRIPKVMLTSLNGSRIPVPDKAPNKGVIRDSFCKYVQEWQSYRCFGMDYAMLVIESLDSDTEIRRISPMAILGDGYVDLINGPQDHGWCSGYTCQRRLSLFHSIVALNKSYEIYFTGTSPQNLRLLLLNVEDNEAVQVAIFFSTLQRLDVYVNNSLVCPENTVWSPQQKDCKFNPCRYTGHLLPKLRSAIPGENYFDRTSQMLYLLVKGSTPVEIHTTVVLFISFNLPEMLDDDFYNSNSLVQNLASFLKISPEKIRITRIIREQSRRRKRSTKLVIELQIGDPPSQSTINRTGGQLQFSELEEITDRLGQAVILGKIGTVLGFNVSSLSISSPVPPSSDSSWIKMTARPVERSQFPVNYLAFISSLLVITQPAAGQQGLPFSQQPSIKAVDSHGNCVSVGITSMTLKAVFKDINNNQISGLRGNTTVPFNSCWANYTDLSLTKTGEHFKIEFVLHDLRVESEPFSLASQSDPSSHDSRGSTFVGTAAQRAIVIVGCLAGRKFLLETFMAAALILKITAGKYTQFCRCAVSTMFFGSTTVRELGKLHLTMQACWDTAHCGVRENDLCLKSVRSREA